MIHRVEYTRKQPGTRYDSKAKCYVGYKIYVRINKKRYRQGGFATRKEAEDFIDALKIKNRYQKAGLKVPQKSKITVSELFEARLVKITNPAERTRGKRVFASFAKIVGLDTLVTDVTRADFQLLINEREGKVKKETIKRDLNTLATAFKTAPELFPKELDGYEPPTIARPRFKPKKRDKIITAKEKDAILKYLYAPQKDETDAEYKNRVRIGRMFHLAWLLGMAKKEVERLKKTGYDGEALSFIRIKTGNPVTFEYLPDEAHRVLRAAIETSETEFVFTHSGSQPKDFYRILQTAIEAAGLLYGRDSGITFHSARHSFVTEAMQHADIKTVGSMSGHSDSTMVMLYTHASPESRKNALQSMYGTKDLKEIFEKVRKGKMSFQEFEKAVR